MPLKLLVQLVKGMSTMIWIALIIWLNITILIILHKETCKISYLTYESYHMTRIILVCMNHFCIYIWTIYTSILHFTKVRTPGARKFFHLLKKEFGTLAFCRRWIDRLGETRYLGHLKVSFFSLFNCNWNF